MPSAAKKASRTASERRNTSQTSIPLTRLPYPKARTRRRLLKEKVGHVTFLAVPLARPLNVNVKPIASVLVVLVTGVRRVQMSVVLFGARV